MNSEPHMPSDPPPPDRRAFINAVCAAIAVGSGGIAMLRARSQTSEAPAPVRDIVIAATNAEVSAFLPTTVGRPVRREIQIPNVDRYRANVSRVPIFLVRIGGALGDVRALSAVCPHAGCVVSYQSEQQRFACPCHQAHFTPSGERIDGPSPRGLDPFDLRVSDDRLVLAYRRYRLNLAERVEA